MISVNAPQTRGGRVPAMDIAHVWEPRLPRRSTQFFAAPRHLQHLSGVGPARQQDAGGR